MGVLQLCLLPSLFRPREGSKENGGARSKRALEEEEGSTDVLSKNKQKKQLRNPHKTFDPSLKRKLLQPPGAQEASATLRGALQGQVALTLRRLPGRPAGRAPQPFHMLLRRWASPMRLLHKASASSPACHMLPQLLP